MPIIPRTGSPMGLFVAAPGTIGPPSPLLADDIDPYTHDFRGLFTGMDVIDSQVIGAIGTLRSSGAAVLEHGLRIADTKITPNVKINISSAVREALQVLIRNRDIDFKGVDFGQNDEGIDPSHQQVTFVAKWVNLRAVDGRVRSATFPLDPSRGRI